MFDGSLYRSVRDIRRALTIDAICCDNLSPHLFLAWCRSVGIGGLASFGGVPILQNFYRRLVKFYDDNVALFSKRKVKRLENFYKYLMKRENHGFRHGNYFYQEKVSDTMRVSFYEAFDITPGEQEVLEQYYDTVGINCRSECESIISMIPKCLLRV